MIPEKMVIPIEGIWSTDSPTEIYNIGQKVGFNQCHDLFYPFYMKLKLEVEELKKKGN